MRLPTVVFSTVALIAAGFGCARTPPSLLIRNASVVDGTGAPARPADVRIVGDRIAEVGSLEPTSGDRIVDGRGLTLAPGFIDTHSHHDRGLVDDGLALAILSQGITTIVAGQDGSSSLPLAELFGRVAANPAAVNVASYVGHGSVRREVLGADFRRAATADEIDRMRELVEREMRAGALGLSTGLEYDPGIYSTTEEVIALAKAVAPFGGRYISHIRSEDRALWEALDEIVEVGRAAGIPVQVSHAKLAMRGLWGEAGRFLDVLDRARASGVAVTADVYPYTYWQSGMTVLFPERDFGNRAAAEFVLRELVAPGDLLVVGFAPEPSYEGKTLADIAALRGTDPAVAMMDMLREAGDRPPRIVATSMQEDDVAQLIAWPFANICSDGETAGAHPRGFGSFPRVLGRYVRERGLMPLEEAVRKMTSLAAANVGITDRGTVASGQFADLVLFDPATIIDHATTAEPHLPSDGIRIVVVNGEIAYDRGEPTGARPGRVLRGGGARQ